jgi:hypothetical protein
VDCDHPEDRFARNKTNPTKEHFLRFDFVVQSIETTGGTTTVNQQTAFSIP